ncbi:MAG TPA: type II toxin-antitoxin system HipA family toxin [Caulobacteraceae bacterium]
MRLAPGVPLKVALAFDAAKPRLPVARLAMADRVAQLEWEEPVIAAGLPVSPLLYPPERGLQAARSREFEGLHGFLADSLPEGWGQLLMRRRLSKLGVNIDTLTPLERLALVGDQGRGALVFEPATAPPDDIESLNLDELAAASAEILAGEDGALADTLAGLAGASGGARPKIHVGFDGDGAISVSDGEIAPGHEAWIVKFPAKEDPIDIGPIEAAYAAMALGAGLNLSAHRLIPAKAGPGYFATRRFDRPAPGLRLHMVSLSGAIEARASLPSSYDTFLRATHAITRHAEDVAAAFRRMVFNVLACNRDDHTRQHSFLMSARGDWRLAPAYDLTFAAGPGGEHYLDIEGEGRHPTKDHVRSLGQRHGLSDRLIEEIIEAVRAAVAAWPRFARETGVTARSQKMITAAHEDVRSHF